MRNIRGLEVWRFGALGRPRGTYSRLGGFRAGLGFEELIRGWGALGRPKASKFSQNIWLALFPCLPVPWSGQPRRSTSDRWRTQSSWLVGGAKASSPVSAVHSTGSRAEPLAVLADPSCAAPLPAEPLALLPDPPRAAPLPLAAPEPLPPVLPLALPTTVGSIG